MAEVLKYRESWFLPSLMFGLSSIFYQVFGADKPSLIQWGYYQNLIITNKIIRIRIINKSPLSVIKY